MQLNLVTPDKLVFDGEIKSVQLPGSSGSFEVLNNHASLISSLDKGNVKIVSENGTEENYIIDGGVAEVLNNKIIVLAEALIVE